MRSERAQLQLRARRRPPRSGPRDDALVSWLLLLRPAGRAHRPKLLPAGPVHRHSLATACAQLERFSRSSRMARARAKAAAMLYSQSASTITNMASSMVTAMVGARVRLMDAPWCKEF